MVNLSLDLPPFGRNPNGGSGPRFGRVIGYLLVAAAVFVGGYFTGRRSAFRTPRAVQHAPQPEVATAPPPSSASPEVQAARPAPAEAPAAPAPQAQGPAAGPAVAGSPPPATAPAGVAPAAGEDAGSAAPVTAETAPPPVAAPPPAAVTPPGAPQGPLVRRVSITLYGPLEESVAAALPAGEKAWAEQLTQVMNRILVWSLQISRDARKGDKLEVLYELPTPQPTEIVAVGDGGPSNKEPVVLALRYGSQKLGRLLTAYRFKPEGAPFARYYTNEGREVEEHLVDSPVSDYEQITSLLRDGRRHKGVDFKTPVGTPVRSPFDGQVTRRNWKFSANGNCLEVVDAKTQRHAIFLHLEAAPKDMQPGRAVKKGEIIAKSGNSGHSTAPHLHYQLEDAGGKVLDPFAVLATRRVSLEGAAKAAFEVERSKLDPMLLAGR
jgi:murein DD-endopeptidase MepM/ murein hydrolase activator NlpD